MLSIVLMHLYVMAKIIDYVIERSCPNGCTINLAVASRVKWRGYPITAVFVAALVTAVPRLSYHSTPSRKMKL